MAVYKFLEEIVSDNMTHKVKTVTRDTTMRELHGMFRDDGFNTYPVEESSHVVGVVTKLDFLDCFTFTPTQLVPRYDDLLSRAVGDVMTSDFIYVSSETKLTRVLQLMVEHKIRSIPVLDREKLAGIIAREDVIHALERCADYT